MEGKSPTRRPPAPSGPLPFLPLDEDIRRRAPRAPGARGSPRPAPGGTDCSGAWPRARPARQRPRCNLLGAPRGARCCGRARRRGRGASAGRTTARPGAAGPAAAAAARRRRAPRGGLGRASPLLALLLGFRPPPPHPPRPKGKEGGRGERPPLGLEGVCAPPAAAAAAQGRGGGGSSAGLRRRRRVWSCFWTAFNSGGKKHLSQGIKKKKKKSGEVGGRSWGKTVKRRRERMFAK